MLSAARPTLPSITQVIIPLDAMVEKSGPCGRQAWQPKRKGRQGRRVLLMRAWTDDAVTPTQECLASGAVVYESGSHLHFWQLSGEGTLAAHLTTIIVGLAQPRRGRKGCDESHHRDTLAVTRPGPTSILVLCAVHRSTHRKW